MPINCIVILSQANKWAIFSHRFKKSVSSSKLIVTFLQPMASIAPDSLIWVRLGSLYGWWPAIFQPANFAPEKKLFPDLEIQVGVWEDKSFFRYLSFQKHF
jgi:hypothetical protein